MATPFLRRSAVCLVLACVAALAGCTSVDPTAGLSPAGTLGGERLSPMGGGEPTTSAASAVSTGPVQFLPVVGAPPATVEALSAALAEAAQGAGVTILPSDEPAAPRRLKGYLSALGEGRETVVVYVFDVVDPAGERVGRIQGQERTPRGPSSVDPWADVPQATLAAIARRTMSDLVRTATHG